MIDSKLGYFKNISIKISGKVNSEFKLYDKVIPINLINWQGK